MEILTSYVRKALDAGIIDEWHVWDFTRSPVDREWVTREFGPARYMHADVPYMHKGTVSSFSSFRMEAAISGDLHLAVLPEDDPDHFYEIVIGGWDNRQSAVRKLRRDELYAFERNNEVLWVHPTPGVLSPGCPNDVVLQVDAAGVPTLHVNDVLIGTWPYIKLTSGASVMVRGGFGSDLELKDVKAPIRRYVGQPNEAFPYYRSYEYYARNLEEFADTVFLKCDDDIVFMDLSKLSDFINFRRENPNYMVVSANVVNNVACAYWQQASGSLPLELGVFEYPPDYGGSLWQDADRANSLHDFFLQREDKSLPLGKRVVETTGRVSINFISWLGRDLRHMGIRGINDERALTLDLPAFLNRPVGIFSDFVVSHLSFGPQETGLHVDRLLAGYRDLMERTLSR
ncbi:MULTISPECIES: hypothetical protein [unclassified Sinorhizobium]|uniref:hypothetical protein n=1 Tax=unclassified Sinorhizobium TaxID=2613772 RepID=UPI003526753C